jgi:hypothetical protein
VIYSFLEDFGGFLKKRRNSWVSKGFTTPKTSLVYRALQIEAQEAQLIAKIHSVSSGVNWQRLLPAQPMNIGNDPERCLGVSLDRPDDAGGSAKQRLTSAKPAVGVLEI